MTGIPGFFDDSFASLLRASPEIAAELGLRAVADQALAHDRWTDASPAGAEARRALVAATLQQLQRAMLEATPAEARKHALDAEIYEFFLRWANFGHLRGTQSAPFAHCDYVADHLGGVQTEVLTCLTQWQPLDTAAEVESYVTRVAAIPEVLDGAIEALRLRVAAGNVMPAAIVRRVQAEIGRLLACAPHEHPIRKRLAEAQPAHAPTVGTLLQGPVAAAYGRLLDYFEAYPAEERLGLWRIPGGEGYYRFLLKAHTTTDLDPEQIHSIGRTELANLQQSLTAKLGAAGHVGGSLAERFAAFGAAQRLDLSHADDPRAQLMVRLQTILHDTERRVRPLFRLWPRAGVELRAIPALQEPNRHAAYVPPAEDGSRPGVFEVHVGHLLGGSIWDLHNLVYHEAMPGHHVQLTIAQELGAGLPAFRRALVHDGYIEGWAKYSELLPWIEKLNTEPAWDIARSRYEIYSTANLVLDTGIHQMRWTREQGIAYLLENTGCEASFAEYLVDRIAARPAQVCAYKLGMMSVLGARTRMAQALGSHFDLRDFHDAVLGNGSVPLSILDRIVDARIALLSQRPA